MYYFAYGSNLRSRFEISDNEIAEMDELESVAERLYRRDSFLVLGEDGAWHRADARFILP